jgi:hypothetical protein
MNQRRRSLKKAQRAPALHGVTQLDSHAGPGCVGPPPGLSPGTDSDPGGNRDRPRPGPSSESVSCQDSVTNRVSPDKETCGL